MAVAETSAWHMVTTVESGFLKITIDQSEFCLTDSTLCSPIAGDWQ